MYEREYRKLVLDDFERKFAAGVLPPEMLAPTRKDLRDHCVKVCAERFKKKDEPLLKSFFGERENPASYLIAVQNSNAENFRTLNNFLKDRSKGTSFTNISLLAWMIDFEPRPFREDLEPPPGIGTKPEIISNPVPLPQTEVLTPIPVINDKNPIEEGPGNSLPLNGPPVKRPWGYIATLLLPVSLTAYYFVARYDFPATDKGGCMIWTSEKYQQVACSYKSEDRSISVIPLDTAVLRRFKKILKDDTLTANSVGKVFCVKINGKYEYYTDSAANPIYPEKPLRRLTLYIMNNNP
jgi:hypothetical protein